MRKILILLLVLLAALILYFALRTNLAVGATDLGVLTYQQPVATKSYCVYKITKVVHQPDGVGYSVNDIFCIECCLQSNPPWPNDAGGTCVSPIDFTTSDGSKYEAKINRLTQGTCITCPSAVRDGYACPN